MFKKKWECKKVHIAALLILLYVVSLFVLSFIGYSDGDDVFFLEYCRNMKFLEYLGWRYETWTGRMASEAVMYLFFNLDLWAWRIVNAGMMAVLPVVLVVLKMRIVPVDTELSENGRLFLSLIMAMLVYLFLDIKAFGYSTIWITGSMNYLWPVVCGMVALCVVAGAAFGIRKENGMSVWKFLLAVVCALAATMSSEQMGAVLLAFEMICIVFKISKRQSVGGGIAVLTVVTMGAFAISSFAPGNELRIAVAVEQNMPQFEALGLGERAFILIQWLVSSFANENAAFLIAIWLVGILLLWEKMRENVAEGKKVTSLKLPLITGTVFLCVAILGKCGVTIVNDMGVKLAELTWLVEQVPQAADMSLVQWMALVWWILALIFTAYFLWKVSNRSLLILLIYLGAVASEGIMIFSPTIYSSGERVFFLAGLMLWIIAMLLYEKLPKGKMRVFYMSVLICIGVGNFVLQIPELMTML